MSLLRAPQILRLVSFSASSSFRRLAMFPALTSDIPTRMRQVAWMPILTQRGVYEKVNSITASGSNNFQMVSRSHCPPRSLPPSPLPSALSPPLPRMLSEGAGGALLISCFAVATVCFAPWLRDTRCQ